MNLFQRAAANLSLSAAERGIRQAVLTFLHVTGPLSSVPLVSHLLNSLEAYTNTGTFPAFAWQNDLWWLLAAFITSAGLGIRHTLTSAGDAPLAQAEQSVESSLLGVLEAKTGVVMPPTVSTPAP